MMQVSLLFHDRHSEDARLSQICACFAVQAGAHPVGAALRRDGLRSSPVDLCRGADFGAATAAHRDARPLPQGIAQWLKV
ncbi:hypothetical protein HV87_14530 [Pseudomonas aeruginosa]|nr:hypothetical protein HV87_14530 [Pseudomonas aeruginosa]